MAKVRWESAGDRLFGRWRLVADGEPRAVEVLCWPGQPLPCAVYAAGLSSAAGNGRRYASLPEAKAAAVELYRKRGA